MNSLRLATATGRQHATGCSRCGQTGNRWDRIADKVLCPECQERLASGSGEPLIEPTEPKLCVICSRRGTVCVQTYPLEAPSALEMDLCPEHLRGLLGRQLGPFGYHQLARQLDALGYHPSEVFLLHDAFYDRHGKALKPVHEEL